MVCLFTCETYNLAHWLCLSASAPSVLLFQLSGNIARNYTFHFEHSHGIKLTHNAYTHTIYVSINSIVFVARPKYVHLFSELVLKNRQNYSIYSYSQHKKYPMNDYRNDISVHVKCAMKNMIEEK